MGWVHISGLRLHQDFVHQLIKPCRLLRLVSNSFSLLHAFYSFYRLLPYFHKFRDPHLGSACRWAPLRGSVVWAVDSCFFLATAAQTAAGYRMYLSISYTCGDDCDGLLSAVRIRSLVFFFLSLVLPLRCRILPLSGFRLVGCAGIRLSCSCCPTYGLRVCMVVRFAYYGYCHCCCCCGVVRIDIAWPWPFRLFLCVRTPSPLPRGKGSLSQRSLYRRVPVRLPKPASLARH